MLSDFPEVTQLPWAFFGRMKQLPKPYLFFFFFLFKKNIYLFGCAGSQLWHVGSLVVACGLLVAACRI